MIDRKGGGRPINGARRRALEAHRTDEARQATERASAPTRRAKPAVPAAVPRDGFEKVTPVRPFASSGLTDVGTAASPPRFNPRADLDVSGRIDILDLSRAAAQYGQSGPGLTADLDGNNRVDILDLSRMAASYGTEAAGPWDLADSLHPSFSALNHMMTVFDDPLRGTVVELGGFIGTPISRGEPTDSHFVIKDGFGEPVLKGKVETFGGKWAITLLKEDLPPSLLRSQHFELSVYLGGADGHWAMNQSDFPLGGNTLLDYITELLKK